jgi:hypothetical protein
VHDKIKLDKAIREKKKKNANRKQHFILKLIPTGKFKTSTCIRERERERLTISNRRFLPIHSTEAAKCSQSPSKASISKESICDNGMMETTCNRIRNSNIEKFGKD